jgi:hypothetical protein
MLLPVSSPLSLVACIVFPVAHFTMLLALVGCVLGAVLIPCFLIRRSTRRVALFAALAWALLLGSIDLAKNLRDTPIHRLEGIPARAEPLVAAIEQFRAANGVYPESLGVLVPTYLDAIPTTGLVGYPLFRYQIPRYNMFGLGYELSISSSPGLPHVDFRYWPAHGAPDPVGPNVPGRIDDWIYEPFG